jgi:hypothetical protein
METRVGRRRAGLAGTPNPPRTLRHAEAWDPADAGGRAFTIWAVGSLPWHDGGHFHCVETTNPAAMKPKPTTMFQLCSACTGQSPVVT